MKIREGKLKLWNLGGREGKGRELEKGKAEKKKKVS